jgi:cysteinyl-tRNA synthetase
MNELTATTGFKVLYTPSQIAIEGETELNQLVEKTVKYYSSLVFTDQNVAEALEAKKDLKALFDALEAQRKDVKREYSKPLVEFESKLKSLADKVKVVSDDINKGIKEFDEKQKLIRQENLIAEITRLAEPAGVDPNEIEIAASWLNKGSFTGTGNLVKKVKEEIRMQLMLL